MGISDFFKPNVEKMEAKKDVEGLGKALAHKDENIRKEALEALGKMGEPAVEPLIRDLEDSGNVAIVLSRIGGPAVEPLIRVLKSYSVSPFPQTYAAEALGRIGDIKAVEPLKQALEEGFSHNWLLLFEAADALDKLGWAPSDKSKRLFYLIGKRKWDEIVSMKEQAIELLSQVLIDTNSTSPIDILVRETEIRGLGGKDDIRERHIGFLDFQREAAEALANMNALEPINQALEEKGRYGQPNIRLAIAIDNSNNKKVIEILKHKVNEADLGVIHGAYRFVIRLGMPTTEELLIQVLDSIPKDYSDIRARWWEGWTWYKIMAEDFLNCGNPVLEGVAREWEENFGGEIKQESCYRGPKWGDGVD